MAKHLAAMGLGVLVGVSGLAYKNQEDSRYIYDDIRNEANGIEVVPQDVSTEIQHLAAIAVGRVSGSITVNGEYDLVRFGPLPNCNVDITMEIPFVAEPIVEISDLAITTTAPDANGQFDVNATLQGDISILNPRSILRDFVLDHGGNGWGQMCDEENYDRLIMTMFDIGGKATNTAAECLVESVKTQHITDANGNQIQTDASAAMHEIYRSDLEVALRALYPNARYVNVAFPNADPNYNFTQTESYRALMDTISSTDDDKYNFNTEAIESCTFESLTLDISVDQNG